MNTRRNVVAAVTLCSLFMVAWLLPEAAASEEAREPARPHAEMALGAGRIDWQPAGDYEQVILTIAGPEGLWLRKEFAAGQPASLDLFDQGGSQLPDGAYSYELQFVPRQAGDRSERPLRQSGSFAVRQESFAASFEERKTPGDAEPATKPKIRNVTAATEVIPEDLVVQGNACVGDLCTSVSPFVALQLTSDVGVGIFFEDVNNPISWARDWLLQANGFQGDNDRFFLADIDAGTIPVSVYGDSPENTLVLRSGKVGIGTAVPGAQLHLSSTATSDAFAGAGPDPVSGPALNFGYGGGSFGRGAGFFNVRPDASATAPNPSIRFATANVERMILTNTGSVGIGTSTPSSKLHVNSGDIRVSGGSFIDDGTTLNVPDFVFEPDYRLMPLDELRAFVSREKHLPNVPSADDVKKDGLNLSQVQMRLLEKVEELTLYTLKQDEQIKAQQARIDELQSELKARLEALEQATAAEPEQ
ncbi:MAG TPA: hypothetical protein VF179_26885 [Thermoanaerobaculia bacterium]|nr:hypothetical protein [Thermoanaerobaculia bacterium]